MWLVTSFKSDQQCCSQAYSWLLLTQSCKAGFIQNKNSLLSSQYSLIVTSLNCIKSRRAPFPPSIAITGTLGRLRKWHKTFTVTFHCFTTDRFWCLLPPGGQFHTWCTEHVPPPEFCHVSFESRVTFSCQQCDWRSAMNTCGFDIWEPALWPEAQSVQWHRLDNVRVTSRQLLYLVHFQICMWLLNSTRPHIYLDARNGL